MGSGSARSGFGRRALVALLASTALSLIAGAVSAEAATFVVTNTNPSGPGSLSEAAGLANSDPTSHDVIQITATGTIQPTSIGIVITGDTEIDGPGARQLTLDGQNSRRLFITNNTYPLTLSGMTLVNGFVNSSLCYGGAILARDGGTLTLRNVAVLNSKVSCPSDTSLGGGIYSAGPLVLENSTVAGNVVDSSGMQAFGGAFYAPSGATIRSSTITGNSATGSAPYGGGAFVDGTGAAKASSIRNSTIASNSALNTANLYIGAGHIISLRDDIIANPNGGGGDCTNNGTLTSEGFNLVSDASCGLNQTTDMSGNPQLGQLANNGGQTDTMLPAATSPVIDHGTSSGLSTDQRGLPRPVDLPGVANGPGSDGSDIGAVEVQLPASSGAPTPGHVALGKPKINKKKGTATVKATVNEAGTLKLTGKGVKSVSVSTSGPGTVTLTIKLKGKSLKALRKHRKAKALYNVVFTPASGTSASASGKVTLKKK